MWCIALGMNESILCPARASPGPESFSNGRLLFIEQRRTRTRALDPDRWAQQGCILYWKDTNGATVVEDLFLDTLPRPVDSMTEGGLYLSHRRGARWSNVACGVVCRGYRVGLLMGEAEPSHPTGIVG